MNTDNILINTQSSIKLKLNKTVYFDPFKIEKEYHDADIIFVTHNHYDHFDESSINNIKNDNTIIVAPKSMESEIRHIKFKNYIFLNPNEETSVDDITIKAIPSYNIDKPFHPRENNWLGYIVTIDNVSYYIAGDTDKTKEAENVLCDIALVPIGGHFTMGVNDAADLIKSINPKVVIPTHYGSIVGDISDGKRFKELLSNTKIEVIEKL